MHPTSRDRRQGRAPGPMATPSPIMRRSFSGSGTPLTVNTDLN